MNEHDWIIDDGAMVRNPGLYEGDGDELAKNAKRAAMAAGMGYRKPTTSQ